MTGLIVDIDDAHSRLTTYTKEQVRAKQCSCFHLKLVKKDAGASRWHTYGLAWSPQQSCSKTGKSSANGNMFNRWHHRLHVAGIGIAEI